MDIVYTNGVTLKVDFTTVLVGTGKWADNDGSIYDIHDIKLPTSPSGKHIAVYSKETGFEDTLENRSYDDGKILSFTCNHVEHWE